ncbi:MAG: 50S ribosomal protein L11 methyltransferase [Bacteroidetes bacterium]|nr:50S ribosomal protein L11 methyltransferase [Bacteroidota bacterium]
MSYIEVIIHIKPVSPGSEILMALLSEIGYESFEETEYGLKAYLPSVQFKMADLDKVIGSVQEEFKIDYHHSIIENQNWNEVWESSYEPIMIRKDIYIRAPFHEEKNHFRYQLLIEPKMSFGTAHHETTYLMMELMLEEKFSGKRVLDMGCGTGILAILSSMLGASEIVAIDNDQNAFENSIENIRKNKCKNIQVFHGDSELISGEYETILANINKNILLKDMTVYGKHLTKGGVLLLSGFYESDMEDIRHSAEKSNLKYDRSMIKNNWTALRFIKL